MSFGGALGALGAAEFFLNLNSKGLTDALKQVQAEVKKTTDEMARDLDKGAEQGGGALEKLRNPIAAATKGIQDFATGIGVTIPQMAALGAAAGVVIKAGFELAEAYKAAAAEANNLAQETQKLELITRTSTESASAFLGLLDRYDISAGTANRSFITLQKAIKDYNEAIATGTAGGAGAEAIGKLGIALTDANGAAVKTEEVFLRVANALRTMEDPVAANTIGSTLLGRGFTTLAGMIGDTDAELRKYLADALQHVSLTKAQENAIINLHQTEKTLEEVQKGVNIQLALMGAPIHMESIKAQIELWKIWLAVMQAMRPVLEGIQQSFLKWETSEIEKVVLWTERFSASLEMAGVQLAKLKEFIANLDAGKLGEALSPELQEREALARGREQQAQILPSARYGPAPVPGAAGGGAIAEAPIDVGAAAKIVADARIAEQKRVIDAAIENSKKSVALLESEHDKWVDLEDKRHEKRKDDIEAQERLDKAANDAAITRLEVAMETELDAAEATHAANIAALDAELLRERDLYDARRTTLELAKRGEERGAEGRRDEALAAEKAAVEEMAESRRRADYEREQGEIKADNASKDGHEAELERLADLGEAEEKNLRDRIEGLGAVRDLAIEGLRQAARAEEQRHEARLEDLENEREAAEDAYKGGVKALQDEAEASRDAADARIEGIRDASEALRDQAEAQIDAIRESSEALREQTEDQIEAIREQTEALRDQHQDQVDAIREQQRLERQQMQERMAAIDAETAARRAAIEEQLGLIDAERQADREAAQDRADQERLQRATEALTEALGAGGDPAKILAAQQDLADAQFQIDQHAAERGRQTKEDELEAEIDAIEAAAQAQKDALEAEQEAKEAAHEAELERLEDELEAAIENAEARIDLLEDQLEAALDINDDQIDLIEDELEAALDANEKKIRAIEDELERTLDAVDQRREVLDEDHERTIEQIEDKQKAENKAFKEFRDVQEDRRREVDKTYKDAKEQLEDQIELEARNAEAAIKREQKRYEDERREVKETRDDAAEKLRIARAQEDQASADRITLANATYKNERDQIWETYDNPETGLFHILDKSWTETQRTIALRRADEDTHYAAVQEQIKKTYTSKDPNALGLIPMQEAAYQEIVAKHILAKADEDAYHKHVQEKIQETYYAGEGTDHPTGLISAQKKAQEDLKKQLEDAVGFWTTWADSVKTQIDKVIDALEKLKRVGVGVPSGPGGGGGGGGGAAFPVPPPFDDSHHVVVYNALLPGLTGFTSGGTHGGHPAADIFATKGENIHAPVSGVSRPATYSKGGNTTTIQGDDGTWYYMAHGDRSFKEGRVVGGEVIGAVGDTGNAKGTHPHLHFAIATNQGIFSSYDGSGDIQGDTRWYSFSGAPEPVGGGNGRNPSASRQEVRAFIAAEAQERSIDPETAVKVVQGEGGLVPMAVGDFSGPPHFSGKSFWPFQLHYGGAGTPWASWGRTAGMGNSFTGATGLQPYDASAWGPSTEWGLDAAKRSGWGPPGGWYGAHSQGITGFMGIGRGFAGGYYAEGGMIVDPTLLVNASTLQPYGMMAEAGPEYIVPQAQMLATDPGKARGAGGFRWFANGGLIEEPTLLVRMAEALGLLPQKGVLPSGLTDPGTTLPPYSAGPQEPPGTYIGQVPTPPAVPPKGVLPSMSDPAVTLPPYTAGPQEPIGTYIGQVPTPPSLPSLFQAEALAPLTTTQELALSSRPDRIRGEFAMTRDQRTGEPARANYHFDIRGPSMAQVARQIRREFERSEWLHQGWR